MASYNRVILMGNLTRDPELTMTAAGMSVCKFGMATNHRYKDREGNMRDEVCFVDCTLFGRGAEVFKQYMAKGKPAHLEGRLHWSQWTAPDGTKRSKLEVVVENFQFVGGRGGEGGAPGAGEPAAAAYAAPANSYSGGGNAYPPPADGGGFDAPAPTAAPPQGEEIPF